MSDVVNKLWGFCHTLRHDGVDYGDYIEQITYLLFLKMPDETGKVALPPGCSWPDLVRLTGTALTDGYVDILRSLGRTPGILGDIYAGAQSRFANPVSLKKLIGLIDEVQWTALATDVKADAYEGLLEKAASEGKKGAGQYFTPRVAIQSIVRCVRPDPRAYAGFTVCDPACGTAGFLVAAYEWLVHEAGGPRDRELWKRVRKGTYFGEELVARPRRLALMNLYLHGVEPTIRLRDALYETPLADRFDVVLTNPPFGTKGANAAPDREDFTIETSNKQLNFVQHVLTILKPGGRAAIVLPDNCLFADKAGEVLAILTQDCDLHTVLRLPRGTFTPYSQGVRANVLFFTRGYPTERTWIYDGRTNVPHVTKKERPLAPAHFTEFERCYGPDPNGRAKRQPSDSAEDRWRSFPIAEVKAASFKLDRFKWLTDSNGDNEGDLPEPEEVVARLQERLRLATAEVNALANALEGNGGGEVSDNELPDGWKRAPLGELADMCLGKMLDKNKNRGKLRPYLRNTNVRWYGFDLSDLLEMKFEDHEERRYSVSAGDVVVFEGGEPGRAAVWNRDDRPEMRFQKAVHRVRCGSFQRPWRLERQLEHYASTGDLAKHFTGTGIYHLTGRSLAQLPIALPPAEEQDSALEGIAKLEASRVVQTSRLSLMTTDLDTFKRSILAKAFRGELVEHEPGETTGGRSLAHTAKTPWRQGSPAEP